MEINLILAVGSLLLGLGSAGLLVVRLSSPTLKGLGWLGGSFGAGSLGALLLSLDGHIPAMFSVAVADALVLAAFVLLHLAFLELSDQPSARPWLGCALLCSQALVDLACLFGGAPGRLRLLTVGILVTAQVAQTARLLIGAREPGLRTPIYFNVVILVSFSAANLFGSLAIALDRLSAIALERITALTVPLYIAVALGLAFGFFWMTTDKLTSELEHMASTDPLTRLYNRRIFLEWCERERLRSDRNGRPFSLLMVDLDHFKQVNDRFGHSVGDAILCAVVERMQDAVRGIDVLGRWGGEEFVVLLPGASIDSAMLVAQRLRRNVEKVIIAPPLEVASTPEPPRFQTVSIGLASYRGPDDGMGDILERADAALYQAKAAGRNRVLTLT